MGKGSAVAASSDFFDDDSSESGVRVLDMMKTGLDAPHLLKHLEVISGREFAYETLTEKIKDEDGKVIVYKNEGRSLAMEAFMQEPMVIEINESTDEKSAPVVYLSVNGDARWIPRGVPVRLPRKFIERLAQSAERTYKTPKIAANEDTDNERPMKIKNTAAYPFTIIEDSNPDKRLVRKWLNRVTKQST